MEIADTRGCAGGKGTSGTASTILTETGEIGGREEMKKGERTRVGGHWSISNISFGRIMV